MRAVAWSLLILASVCICSDLLAEESAPCLDQGNGIYRPNHDSELIKKAYAKLSIPDMKGSLWLHPLTARFLSIKKNDIVDVFLSDLCNSYADNPALLKAKLTQIESIKILKSSEQRYDATGIIWDQLTQDGYHGLIFLSESLARFREVTSQSNVNLKPISACEMKFIFERYLSQYRSVENLSDYVRYSEELSAYEKDALKTGKCNKSDQENFFAFRGEPSLTPLGSEARGSYLLSYYLKNICGQPKVEEPKACKAYRLKPSASREAFSAHIFDTLLRWPHNYIKYLADVRHPLLFLFQEHNTVETLFSASSERSNIISENINGYLSYDSKRLSWLPKSRIIDSKNANFNKLKSELSDPSIIRLNGKDQFDGAPAKRKDLETRLQIIFDRHANYYSMYLMDPARKFLSKMVTPLISASPYPYQSHRFTLSGFSSNNLDQSKMGVVYIYKIASKDLVTKGNLNESPALTNAWYEESSFALHPFGLDEKAILKLHSPTVGQLETIIFLGNMRLESELANLLLVNKQNKN